MMCPEKNIIKVLNIHWGFSIGGVAQYAAVMEGVQKYASIEMSTVCVLSRKRHIDEQTLAVLGNLVVIDRVGPLDLRWIGALRSIIKSNKPHIIFSHGFNAHFVAMIATIFLNDKPCFVASYHGQYHPPTPIKKLVEGLYNGFTDWYMRHFASAVVSVAEVGGRYLVSKGVDPNKITVIHNGIPDAQSNDSIENLRQDLGLPVEGLVIGVVSRLEPIKGISYLIQAFHCLVEEFPDSFLVLIGAGVQEASLKQQVEDLGMAGRVHFAGFRFNAGRYLPAIDVFTLPSLSEFHSIGLLEAMRAGRAIVATDVGGNTESITNDVEGLIVRSESVEELEVALRRLLTSEDLRLRLGTGARARFEAEFLVEVMVRRSAEFLCAAAEKCNVRS